MYVSLPSDPRRLSSFVSKRPLAIYEENFLSFATYPTHVLELR